MLKHKLRKSRKNILSLLDYAQEQEDEMSSDSAPVSASSSDFSGAEAGILRNAAKDC